MIRKAIIAVLTMAATAAVAVWVDSYCERERQSKSLLNPGPGYETPDVDFQNKPMGRAFLYEFVRKRYVKLTTHAGRARIIYAHFPDSPDFTVIASPSVPIPFVVAVFAAYPTIAFIRGPLRRWRRRRKGLCVECGYDLRGSMERCPECGIRMERP